MSAGAAFGFSDRVELSQLLLAHKQDVAGDVNDEFFRRHPEWRERYGHVGVLRGFEDACYHVEYLAASIEAGSTELFETYARWTARVLDSRGIGSRFVVENFEQLADALRSRVSPDQFEVIARHLAAGSAAASEPPAPGSSDGPDTWRSLFRAAILRGQRGAALNIALDALSQGLTLAEFHEDVCAPALWSVGEMWERNRIAVADEHLATAVAQYVIAQIYSRSPLPAERRGNVIVTGVEGEMHQLGANMFADILETEGWCAYFLGSNLPHGGILRKIEEHEAAAVCISVTMPFNLPQARKLVGSIRGHFGSRVRIILGGSAFRSAPDFYKETGADGQAASARSGAALLRRLIEDQASTGM
jgi:methanogenic corrinoid protein MtbC1